MHGSGWSTAAIPEMAKRLEAGEELHPVVTSNTTAMPETADGAAVLSDPTGPASIARATTGSRTLDVYREMADGTKKN